jgi:hypothetical protein
MKYIKYYEHSIEDEPTKPQIGDSVICTDIDNREELDTFLSTNIGTIIRYDIEIEERFPYVVQYNHIPDELIKFFSINNKTRHFSREEILQFAPQLNKYNL